MKSFVDLEKFPSLVQETLESSMSDLAGSHCAVMFSGGFDSMLMACLAQRCGVQVTGVTIQFDDFNPLTVAGAIEFANKVGIDHHIIQVKAVEFLSAFEELMGIINEPLLDLDLAVVYAALKKYDHRIAGNIFISGMGSDQWFGNEALEQKPGEAEKWLDWSLAGEDAHQRVAQNYGCRFIFPFLSKPMIRLSRMLPSGMKKDKKLLRGLPVAVTIPHGGTPGELQVPSLMRHILIKTYGDRAWPDPVTIDYKKNSKQDEVLRQIILGLWLGKNKSLTKP